MKILVDESPVGVGKTYKSIERMVRYPTRYIFATERVESMSELQGRIYAAAASNNRMPHVIAIHSGNGELGSVSRQIGDLPAAMFGQEHVIALISHEGLMMSDFDNFVGWTLIVDEVPSMISIHNYRTPTDLAFFEEHYTLTAIGEKDDRWHKVGLTKAGASLKPSDIEECDSHRYLRHFHRRCNDPRLGPVVDLREWREMAEPNKSWVWWSLFHPGQIEAFDTIIFLGNAFTKSLSFALFNDASIEWEVISENGSRPLRRRHARVVYYSGRPSSLFYFKSREGQADLRKIGRWIADNNPQPFFWSSNEVARDALSAQLGADNYQRPKQAGTSRLMAYHSAAMFYAAKPSSDIETAISGLGSDAAQWIETNEYETILQFLTRTSVRDVNSTHDVVLHVFNRDQAEYLKRFFDSQPHISCDVEKVELELSTQERRAPGRKAIVLTAEERERAKAAKREKHKIVMRERRAKAREAA